MKKPILILSFMLIISSVFFIAGTVDKVNNTFVNKETSFSQMDQAKLEASSFMVVYSSMFDVNCHKTSPSVMVCNCLKCGYQTVGNGTYCCPLCHGSMVCTTSPPVKI
jgi:hypothetical protein